jgi:hypothetical protein
MSLHRYEYFLKDVLNILFEGALNTIEVTIDPSRKRSEHLLEGTLNILQMVF